MNRLTHFTLVAFVAVTFFSTLAVADPPTNDTANRTDRQVLEDLQEKIRESRLKLDVLIGQIQMLDGKLKELGGLGDKIDQVDRKVDKKAKDLEVMINQALADQKTVLEQLQKHQQAIDELRRLIVSGGPSGTEAFKLPTKPLDPDVEQRFQRVEQDLNVLGGQVQALRRATPLPLPALTSLPETTRKTSRLVRVVNQASFPITIYFDDMPFRVEANSDVAFTPPQDTFTYEVPSSNLPRKTLNLAEGKTMTLRLSWP